MKPKRKITAQTLIHSLKAHFLIAYCCVKLAFYKKRNSNSICMKIAQAHTMIMIPPKPGAPTQNIDYDCTKARCKGNFTNTTPKTASKPAHYKLLFGSCWLSQTCNTNFNLTKTSLQNKYSCKTSKRKPTS